MGQFRSDSEIFQPVDLYFVDVGRSFIVGVQERELKRIDEKLSGLNYSIDRRCIRHNRYRRYRSRLLSTGDHGKGHAYAEQDQEKEAVLHSAPVLSTG